MIGLGTWQFGSREWGYGARLRRRRGGPIVARARELGVTVFDTAEIYGFGRSERILGAALRASGGTDDVVVATKVFPVLPTARGRAAARRGQRPAARRAADRPLPGAPAQPAWSATRTTMRGMRALRDVGIVDEVGVSNYPLRRWQRAEAALGAPVLSNQVQFSLVARGPMAEMLPWAQRTGHVVMAYSPLAQGLLSGRYDAQRTARPAASARPTRCSCRENLRRRRPAAGAAARGRRRRTAPRRRRSALAWLVHFPNVVAIPGASSVAQVESNAAAADIALAADEHAALTAAAEAFRP